MKNFSILTLLGFLLTSCAPVEEGVYFEINGKAYQTNEGLEYAYASDNSATPNFNPPMYFYVTYDNSDFRFSFTTYNFHKGNYYFNKLVEGYGAYEVNMGIQIKNEEIAEVGFYSMDANSIGSNNFVEILRFEDHLVEIRFCTRLLKDNKSIDLKNGYLKVNI